MAAWVDPGSMLRVCVSAVLELSYVRMTGERLGLCVVTIVIFRSSRSRSSARCGPARACSNTSSSEETRKTTHNGRSIAYVQLSPGWVRGLCSRHWSGVDPDVPLDTFPHIQLRAHKHTSGQYGGGRCFSRTRLQAGVHAPGRVCTQRMLG